MKPAAFTAAGAQSGLSAHDKLKTPDNASHSPASGSSGSQLTDDLRAALVRERERLQVLFGDASRALAAREAELGRRSDDLQRRERELRAELERLEQRERESERSMRERAAAVEGAAQQRAEELLGSARERCEELEAEMLAAQSELQQSRCSSEQQIQTMLSQAERTAEQILAKAHEDAQAARERIVELLRLREGLIVSVQETLRRFSETLNRAERQTPPQLIDADLLDEPAAADRQSDPRRQGGEQAPPVASAEQSPC